MGDAHDKNKAARPIGRVLRNTTLPAVLNVSADSKALRKTFAYHFDWDAPSEAA